MIFARLLTRLRLSAQSVHDASGEALTARSMAEHHLCSEDANANGIAWPARDHMCAEQGT
jgi:hypothetical protein